MSHIKVDAEDFSTWRHGPMAEHFFKAIEMWAEDAKQAWISASWDGGKVDPILHAALKERYVALKQLQAVTAIEIEEKINEQNR